MEKAVNKNAVACCSKRTAGDKREAGWFGSALVAKFEEKFLQDGNDLFGFSSRFPGLAMFLQCPEEEPFLHRLAEGAGGFACNDSNGAGGEVELFPLEVAYVSESLPECAYAAADGRCPFIRQFVDEEVYFFKSKGFVYNFSPRLSADTLTLLQGLRVTISASSAHVNAARMAERSLRHVAARTSFRLYITHSLMSAFVMSRMGASACFPNHFRKCLYDVCALL